MSTNVHTHISRKVSIIVCTALAFALALVLSFLFSIPSFADEGGQPAAVTTQENAESSATGENTGDGEETTTTVVAESTVEAATTVNTQAPEQPAPNAAAATETETTTTTATAAPSVQAQAQTETSQSASGASEEQATETISDEEVPLAASIAGSEPIPLKVINNDLHRFILLVIVIIGVIFLVRTGRMNRSIDKMRKFTK